MKLGSVGGAGTGAVGAGVGAFVAGAGVGFAPRGGVVAMTVIAEANMSKSGNEVAISGCLSLMITNRVSGESLNLGILTNCKVFALNGQ